MFDMWKEEPTEAEVESVIEKAADGIRKRKLEAPAIIALEMHKPLAGIAGYGAVAMAPFLVPILGFDRVNEYSQIFSKRENIERLLLRLEQPSKVAQVTETQ